MKQILIIAILGCLGWNAQAEGTLRLLNTKFDHPQLRDWAAAHPSLVTAQLQHGLDVMGLQDAAGEGKLSQSADSLGLAHGFLTFDYRISGLLASFTEETAGKLLPEIQQKMGAEFGVGAGQPYALLITWVSFQGKQLELLFHVNYEGFSRKSSYTTEQLALYKDLSASVFQTGDDEVNAILKIGSLVGTAWSRSASTVMKLYLLLLNAPIPGAYFRVAGRSYGVNDTLFLCICDSDTVQVTAYQSPNVLFPSNTKWKGFKNNHPGNGPIAGFESKNRTDSVGIFIEAYFKDQSGQNQSAALRVVVFEVDFSSASNTYFFDPNEIKTYKVQYEKTRKILDKPKRWLFINDNMQEQAKVSTTPNRNIFARLRSSSGIINQISSSIFRLSNLGRGEHQVVYDGLRCDSLELGVFSRPQKNVNASVIIVDDFNDDIQVIPPPVQVAANGICITAGPNGAIDSRGIGDDVIDRVRNEIRCGPDRLCSSIAMVDDIQVIPPPVQVANNSVCITAGPNNVIDSRNIGDDVIDRVRNEIRCGPDNICSSITTVVNPVQINVIQTAMDSVRSVFGKAGVNLIIAAPVREAIYYDLNGNDSLDLINNHAEQRRLNLGCTRCVNNVFVRFFFVPVMGLLTDPNTGLRGHVEGHATRGAHQMFIDVSGGNVVRTTVHEFGHGEYSLFHPWDEFAGYNNTQQHVLGRGGSLGQDPANLMDYQGGWKLRKYQWVHIHN